MANRCASLGPTWSYLPASAPSSWPQAAWFSPAAAAFENDALASALVFASMSPSSPTPSTSTTTSSTSELYFSIAHDAPPPPLSCTPVPASGARPQARRCTGRVSKRKPRASRRAPATYITADPADFRRMVQEVTGFRVPGAERSPEPPRPAALAFVLPTLDTSASFLLDRTPAPPQPEEDRTSSRAAIMSAAVADGAEDPSLLLMQELEALVSAQAVASAFPTLESWGMI